MLAAGRHWIYLTGHLRERQDLGFRKLTGPGRGGSGRFIRRRLKEVTSGVCRSCVLAPVFRPAGSLRRWGSPAPLRIRQHAPKVPPFAIRDGARNSLPTAVDSRRSVTSTGFGRADTGNQGPNAGIFRAGPRPRVCLSRSCQAVLLTIDPTPTCRALPRSLPCTFLAMTSARAMKAGRRRITATAKFLLTPPENKNYY